MRKEFDQDVPEEVQRMSMPPKMHTGRKHMKRPGPGKNKLKDIAGVDRKKKRIAAFKAAVSAYFNGGRDTYPKKP